MNFSFYTEVKRWFRDMKEAVQVSLHYCHVYNPRTKCYGLPQVPRPRQWQLIWLPSFFGTLLGFYSLEKNRLTCMQICFFLTFLLGLGPIIGTMILNSSDVIEHVSAASGSRKHNHQKKSSSSGTSPNVYGVPLIVIWYMFLAICLQVHLFGMYFARILVVMWSDESAKKKKQ